MEGYREFPSDYELESVSEAPAHADVSAAIGTDERRMHVRAYNYWVSLLGGRDFPSIEDLEPDDIQDFSSHSVLLDFTCGRDNPAIAYVGGAIRDECALNDDVRTIADVPSRSLLSRLTDHYMQIIANRAPVGFEAEFENPRGESLCYRGILMPFSSDDDTIDFIYGVINWKNASEQPVAVQPLAVQTAAEPEPLELTEPLASEIFEPPVVEPEQPASFGIPEIADEQHELASFGDTQITDEQGDLAHIALDEASGLADRLWAARETAETVKAGEGRTRAALYRALSLAYDFAVAAQDDPDGYAELLEESGVKAQARAPMTPIVKLVFGIDYDKARLTEFAAALSFAQRQQIALGGFQQFIEAQAGGLKALVAAERQARRPEATSEKAGDAARAKLRTAPPIALDDIPAAEEFAVVLTRRGSDGRHEAVAVVEDPSLLEKVIRKAA